jgi:hypothetical protein
MQFLIQIITFVKMWHITPKDIHNHVTILSVPNTICFEMWQEHEQEG